jgi:hypothetical protein
MTIRADYSLRLYSSRKSVNSIDFEASEALVLGFLEFYKIRGFGGF